MAHPIIHPGWPTNFREGKKRPPQKPVCAGGRKTGSRTGEGKENPGTKHLIITKLEKEEKQPHHITSLWNSRPQP